MSVTSLIAHQSETYKFHGYTPVMPIEVLRESIIWMRGAGLRRLGTGKAWVQCSEANYLIGDNRAVPLETV